MLTESVMEPEKTQATNILFGEITHMIEEGGKCTLTVAVQPFFLSLDDHAELHLGDKVQIRTKIKVLDVQQEFVTK